MGETKNYIAARLSRMTAQLPYLPRALLLVWEASRGWTLLWVTLLIIQGLLPAVTVYLTRSVVNGLAAAAGSNGNWASVRPTILLALLMGLVMLLSQVLGSVSGWVKTAQSELVGNHVSALVQRQSASLDLAFYDSAAYYDHLHRARAQARYRPLLLLDNLGGLVQNGITLVAMAAVLLPYGAWVPLVLLLSTLPALGVVLRFRIREHQWQVTNTVTERHAWYYDWLLTERQVAAELRLFALAGRFQELYQAVRRRLFGERLKLNRDEGLARLVAGSLALVVTGAVMAYMIWRAVQGRASLGDLALFYSAFSQGQGLMRSLLENLAQIYSNILFLGDLFAFLALKPLVVDPIRPRPYPCATPGHGAALAGASSAEPGEGKATGDAVAPPAISLKGVCFRYPGGGRLILQDLNLDIEPGQLIAIVGPNGAGKSTMIKLLCRFYDPEAGRIELNGVDLRDLALADIRGHTAVLFQEPVKYNASVAENIALGHAGHSAAAIERAARAAGAEVPIQRLPRGYDTLLGTWFEGGTDLSLGEWQRIALARAFLRQAPLVILDEPTSAMDSWAEIDWLARFRYLVKGRTAIIITHRFTTARYADVIYVMDEGRIVESGSHEELLIRNGAYARSWNAQVAEPRATAA